MYDDESNRPSSGETPQPPGGANRPGFDYGPPATYMPPPLVYPPPQASQVPPTEPPRRRRGWVMGLLGVGLVLLGAVSGSASTWFLSRKLGPTPIVSLQGPVQARSVVLQGEASAITEVFRKVGPAVVRVEPTIRTGTGLEFGPNGFRQVPQTQIATGSGFVFDNRGYILTNNHVVNGAQQISVFFQDGASYPATVVGKDPENDLAVLKIDPGNRQLAVVPLGDSDAVEVGEPAIAIGAPFGLDHTVTAGIISGRNRSRIGTDSGRLPPMLQTDASINPGNSGGPLLDAAGNVIGINTAIESPVRGSVGVGFAIPINQVKSVLPALMQGKTPQHPRLGISGIAVTGVNRRITPSPEYGVVIVNVVADSAADKAGLQGATLDERQNIVRFGDVITGIDGQPIKDVPTIQDYLAGKQVGEKITADVWNNGKTRQVSITLSPLPEDGAAGRDNG